jgi:hypothetical protein
MEMNNENIIDRQVRQALENLEVPYQVTHWTQMAEKLDALDTQDADFDTHLKNRLDNAPTPSQPSRWDLMQQRLDTLDTQDTQFDDILRQRVEQNYTKYQPKHWDIMSRRLDEEFSWKAKIVRYRVAEVALLLLVLFTIFNYLDTAGDDGPIIPFRTEVLQAKKMELPAPKSFNKDENWHNRAPQSKSKNAQLPIVSIDIAPNSNNISSNQNIENQVFIHKIKATNLTNSQLSKTDLSTKNAGDVLNHLPIVNASEIALSKEITQSAIGSQAKKEAFATIEPVAIARPNALSITHLFDEPIIVKRKSKWWTLGVFTSGSIDKVSSSYVYKSIEKKWNNWSVNKGAGFTLSKHKGVVELESGLSYHHVQYNTDLPSSVLEGRVVTGALKAPILTRTVELGLIQLPLSAKIHTPDMGKWNIYASAGITGNAAFGLDTLNFPSPPESSALSISSRSYTQFPDYGRSFVLGVNKNENNFYFTANLGIGAEYRLTPLVSMYLQPQVEHHITNLGIGSRKDRINTLSVQGGIKMRMGLNVNKY